MTQNGRPPLQRDFRKHCSEGVVGASRMEDEMIWVKTENERHCGNCGLVLGKWILHSDQGHRVAEANFCPLCYPDVDRIFHTPEAVREAA